MVTSDNVNFPNSAWLMFITRKDGANHVHKEDEVLVKARNRSYLIVDSVSRPSQFFNETQMNNAQANMITHLSTRLASTLDINAFFALLSEWTKPFRLSCFAVR